ncbi:MAG: histidine phosphatase family protein [Phycisphaerae bacterium]
MKVALIPCGVTDWRQKGRLLSRVELELTPVGETQCAQWGEQLRPLMLSKIFHAPDELSKATALHIGRRLNIPTKALGALIEVDLGLWAGLTEDQLKKRYAKAHRQLVDSPLSVSPPQGEGFSEAAHRVRTCLKKRIKPDGPTGIGLVMRPLTFAMARYVLEGAASAKIWETSQRADGPVVMDCVSVTVPAADA